MITGNISPLARDVNGFSGITFKIVSVIVWLIVTLVDCPVATKFKPIPGLMTIPIRSAIVMAIAVVTR